MQFEMSNASTVLKSLPSASPNDAFLTAALARANKGFMLDGVSFFWLELMVGNSLGNREEALSIVLETDLLWK